MESTCIHADGTPHDAAKAAAQGECLDDSPCNVDPHKVGHTHTQTFTTYHPLLVESHYCILLCQLLLGDIAAASEAYLKTTHLVDGVEGYPVFLPARSMAQAEFLECVVPCAAVLPCRRPSLTLLLPPPLPLQDLRAPRHLAVRLRAPRQLGRHQGDPPRPRAAAADHRRASGCRGARAWRQQQPHQPVGACLGLVVVVARVGHGRVERQRRAVVRLLVVVVLCYGRGWRQRLGSADARLVRRLEQRRQRWPAGIDVVADAGRLCARAGGRGAQAARAVRRPAAAPRRSADDGHPRAGKGQGAQAAPGREGRRGQAAWQEHVVLGHQHPAVRPTSRGASCALASHGRFCRS